jgi:CRP-like cAMP-binding protein
MSIGLRQWAHEFSETWYKLLRGPFLTFLQTNPKSLYLMLETALRESNAARDHMLLLGCGTAEEKFAEFITSWRARVGRGGVLSNMVPLSMSRKDVADSLGVATETISRVLAKLERENVVRVLSKALQLMGSTERAPAFRKKL